MKILENQQLQSYNTFMVPALCDRLVQIESEEEIPQLLAQDALEGPHLLLGGGSNMLFISDFHGTVVQVCTQGIRRVEEDARQVRLSVAAGVPWSDLVDFCIQNHYYGLENLVGIPGWVGSCPVQNIGAYGVEVKDVITKVEGYRIRSRMPFSLANAECRFGYRTSIFKTDWKGDVIISRVEFRLSKEEHFNLTYQGLRNELEQSGLPVTIESVAAVVKTVRDRKLPDITKIGCAGSFFKNPVIPVAERDRLLRQIPNLVSYPAGEGMAKLAAGQLIDLAGLKGVRRGNVGVYPQQALVLVNYGGAMGAEVYDFYLHVRQTVRERFGILLEAEVNQVGMR
jgi:UDP-N-acetylmuramate dehydrogenase